MDAYQQISTNTHAYQQVSSIMNKHECISTNINTYQRISININTYIRKYPQASIHTYKYEWKSNKINDNGENKEISTNTTKQVSANIYHKYLALGQFALPSGSRLCENYVKTHYMAPKSFQPSAGRTNWNAESTYINK